MSNSTNLAEAVVLLRETRYNLLIANLHITAAATRLTGARQSRSRELGEKIADCLAFAERLQFIVYGDWRAEQ